MNEERDPLLESLFAEPVEEPASDQFVSTVMAQVEHRQRTLLLGRIAIIAAILLLEFALASPLQSSVSLISDLLSVTLIDTSNAWLGFFLTPVNSVAGIVGLMLLGIHLLYRRFMV